jgi:hypothetical protein
MKYAAHWALYPRSYTVYPVPRGPLPLVDQIDGDLTKEIWSQAPWSQAFGDIKGKDGPDPPAPALTQFKAMYDDDFLYIGALVHPSPDVPATEAHYVHRNDPIFQLDSDFEVFIDITGCNHQYKEFEVNAINTVWNLLLDKPYGDGGVEHSGRIASPGDTLYYDVHHQKTAARLLNGTAVNDHEHGQALWSVELALAYKDLYVRLPEDEPSSSSSSREDERPQPGDFWRINFSRVEDKGDINWTWQSQTIWDPKTHAFEGKINMHLPDAWGYFYFADEDRQAHPSPRDPTWPQRLVAMHVYYAQRAFAEANAGRFAEDMKDLEAYVDPSIVEGFGVSLLVKGETYTALITPTTTGDAVTAIVTQDRRLTVHKTKSDE